MHKQSGWTHLLSIHHPSKLWTVATFLICLKGCSEEEGMGKGQKGRERGGEEEGEGREGGGGEGRRGRGGEEEEEGEGRGREEEGMGRGGEEGREERGERRVMYMSKEEYNSV